MDSWEYEWFPGMGYNETITRFQTNCFHAATNIKFYSTFYSCINLFIVICKNVTYVNHAFYFCRNLASTDYSFPDINDISDFSFYTCTSLLGIIKFPKVVKISGNGVFTYCSDGIDLYLPSCIYVSETAFSNTKMMSLHFSSTNKETIKALSGYPSFGGSNITVYWDAE